jgi:Na+/proline symporter
VTLAGLGVLALLAYVALTAGVAEMARRARRDHSPADHFLAARSLGPVVLLLTLYATAYSGNSLLGYPGEAYRRGFSWVMSTGFMSAIIVLLHVVVPPLRRAAVRHRFVTPGDWITYRFGGDALGRTLRIVVALSMAVACANFLLAQLMAMGHVAGQITGGALPYWAGVILLAAMVLIYETLGGMRAVAWTDTAQGLLMLVALGFLVARLLGDFGGLGDLTRAVAAVRPAAVAVPDAAECANWFSSLCLLGVGSVVYPQVIQRIYAAESGRALTRALAAMTVMPLVTTTVVALIGLAAIPRLSHLTGIAADTVMPRMLTLWAAEGASGTALGVLVLVGALAAIMSTADSVLLALASVVAGDVFGRPGDADTTTRFGQRVAVAIMGVAVLVALVPRLTLWRLIELKMELLVQCAPAYLLAARWPGLRAGPTLAGLLAGTALTVVAMVLGVSRVGGVHAGVWALAANVTVAVVGSLARSRRLASGSSRASSHSR